ncbi:hypothetical protein [Methanosarcina mazei]|uniref:hypothetical protein n=1 Tax=Methanosarcina mazei TaxID=2209 RepID=UPI000A6DCDAA|nr:hypothetical protein [Methanosarcina mazei]
MSSVQIDKTGRVMVNIPKKLAVSMGIEKGDIAHVMKGEADNEIKIVIEKV